MYKEPLALDVANRHMKKRIEQKITLVAERLVGEQTDTDFMMNLFNLCVLNSMAESHERPDDH